MNVFVSVYMRDANVRSLQLANLCAGLSFHLLGLQASGKRTRSEGFQAIAKSCRSRTRRGNRRNLRAVENWLSVDQHDVAAYAQAGRRLR